MKKSRRGRKRHPTVLLRLRGSLNPTRARRERAHEPQPVGDLTEPPPDLTEDQREIWTYAVAHAPPGVMKRIDLSLLTAWCVMCDRHNVARLAQAALDTDNRRKLLIRTVEGVTASPYLSVIDSTTRIMLLLASQFGFSPATRPVAQGGAVTDPWTAMRVIDGGKD